MASFDAVWCFLDEEPTYHAWRDLRKLTTENTEGTEEACWLSADHHRCLLFYNMLWACCTT